MDRFETDQKALTAAPAGTAAPSGPATALASPGTSRTELMRVFYVVLYPYMAKSRLLSGCGARQANFLKIGKPWRNDRPSETAASSTLHHGAMLVLPRGTDWLASIAQTCAPFWAGSFRISGTVARVRSGSESGPDSL